MSTADNTFSMSSTMFDALQNIRFSKGISSCIPPPGFRTARASAVAETRLNPLFNFMTSGEGVAQFKDTISKFDRRNLHVLVSLLTSDADYFVGVVRNKHGSRRVQKLIGISDDVDAFFHAAILRRFLHVMTDKYASYVATRAMVVFDQEKKKAMYERVLYYALHIALYQHGCIALNDVITDADDPFFRNQLLDVVAHNALFLSNDASGNFVVQHVLKQYDLRCTHKVAVSLRGHCVDLSLNKYGSYILENLLEADEESMAVVVVELLECGDDRLMRLARNLFGSFVVAKALRVTHENRIDLFWDLVQKLMPFLDFFRRSHGSSIANILESCSITTRCLN